MNDTEINKAAYNLINYCLALTLRLTRLESGDNAPAGVASGFFTKIDGAIYLISAGHAINQGRWVIETDLVIESECRTACIPINGAWIIKSFRLGNSDMERVDISWAKVDLEAFKKDITGNKNIGGKPFECLYYQGEFGETPDTDTPYIFAAQNRVLLYEALGKRHLEREPSYECEMRYTGGLNKDGLYVFSIPKHQGHPHYKGASGAPIIDPEGRIYAILTGGCETNNQLFGFPLRGIKSLIRTSEAASQRT